MRSTRLVPDTRDTDAFMFIECRRAYDPGVEQTVIIPAPA